MGEERERESLTRRERIERALERGARVVLLGVGAFLLAVGVHEVLLARDLAMRLVGVGLIVGGLSGLVAFPMDRGSRVRLIAPVLCGFIGMMVGGYLVAAVQTPPGAPLDRRWLAWLALAVLAGAAGGVVLVLRRRDLLDTPRHKRLAIGSALTALASVIGVAQFARDTVYEPSLSGAAVALQQEMTARPLDDGRVRLTLHLEATNVSEQRVAVVGSLCTVRAEQVVRSPRLGADDWLLRRAAAARQPAGGLGPAGVTRGSEEGRGAVLHSMRPTSDGLYLEAGEPWSLSRVVVVPAGDRDLFRWRCQLDVAKGDRLLRRDPEPDWHQEYGGVVSAGVLQHWIGYTGRLTVVEERLRVSESSVLRRWAKGRQFIAWRRSTLAYSDGERWPSLDQLQVYVDRVGRPRDTAAPDSYVEHVRADHGLVVTEGVVEIPAPRTSPVRPRAARVAASPPRYVPVRDPARLAASLSAQGRPDLRGLSLDPDTLTVVGYRGDLFAVARETAGDGRTVTFRREGRSWSRVATGLCTPVDDRGVPVIVWRHWGLYHEASRSCVQPLDDDRASEEALATAERSLPPLPPEGARPLPLASAVDVGQRLYIYDDGNTSLVDPAGPAALRRLQAGGFAGGHVQEIGSCVDGSPLDACPPGLFRGVWRYVLMMGDARAAEAEVAAVAREIGAPRLGDARDLGDLGVPGARAAGLSLPGGHGLGAAVFPDGDRVYGVQVSLGPEQGTRLEQALEDAVREVRAAAGATRAGPAPLLSAAAG